MTKISAYIDASSYAHSVCDHAAWVAGRMGGSVEVLHVLGRRDMHGDGGDLSGALDMDARDTLLAELSAMDEQKAKLAQKRGRLILDQAKKRLEGAGVASVTTKLRIGDLVETVHDQETSADLIVIGKRGEAAAFASQHLGSNLERVVRASSKPVLVAARAFKPISRILIAYDGGPSVSRAINFLAGAGTGFSGLEVSLLKIGQCTDDATARVEQAAQQLRSAGYQVETRIVPGHPETVIADAVANQGFDLLVMGAYGHSRIRTLMIGSTTTELMRSCKVPVVLFR
ncbi:MAG: universal stress protein [Rhizobiales bacterium]|nr:universal stress protein [Hyphomicrobiales bacterium]